MARFNVVGFDAVERALLRREKAAVEAVPKMLEAGAEVLVKGQQAVIQRMELVDWGDLVQSVKATKVINTGANSSVEVYPQGKDRKGVRNAEKAFVAEYGKSNMTARPWMATANNQYAKDVHEAMRKVWEAMINA